MNALIYGNCHHIWYWATFAPLTLFPYPQEKSIKKFSSERKAIKNFLLITCCRFSFYHHTKLRKLNLRHFGKCFKTHYLTGERNEVKGFFVTTCGCKIKKLLGQVLKFCSLSLKSHQICLKGKLLKQKFVFQFWKWNFYLTTATTKPVI